MPSASNDALSLRPDKGKRKACRLPAEWRVELRSSETTIAIVWVQACGGLDLMVTEEMGTWVPARYVLQVYVLKEPADDLDGGGAWGHQGK